MSTKKFEMRNFQGVVKGSDEYNDIIKERNAVKKLAMETIIAALNSVKDEGTFDPEVYEALEVLSPKTGGAKAAGSKKGSNAKYLAIANLFAEIGDEVEEDDIFAEFKYGRDSMRTFLRDMIKRAEPAERKYVSFDPETGIYKLEAIGENPPANWDGYVLPTVVETESETDDSDDSDEDNEDEDL